MSHTRFSVHAMFNGQPVAATPDLLRKQAATPKIGPRDVQRYLMSAEQRADPSAQPPYAW